MTSASPRTRTGRPGRRRSLALALLAAVAGLQVAASLGVPGVPDLARLAGAPALPPRGSPSPAGTSPAPGAGSPAVGTSSPAPVVSATAPAPSVTPSPVVTQATLDLLDARLAELREGYGIPGVSATILFKDGSRWSGVSGRADVAREIPVRPGTPFAIASLSKTFTAALILQLVEEGRLTLEEPAAPRLPALAGFSLDRRITIGQLLDHTSGLADFLTNPKIEPALAAKPDAAWTPSQALAYTGKALGAPGAVFAYSNTNYLLLGLVAEQVTGGPLATALRDRFLAPLGLRTASYQGVEPPSLPLARAYRFTTAAATETPILVPSGTASVPFNAVVTASGGAGSLAGSSPDVAAWARALFTGGVVRAATVSRMIDAAARAKAIDPDLPYGLGVQVVEVDGHPSFGHTGRYLGARAVVRHFPIEGLTIAILTNQSRVDPSELLVELLRVAHQG